MFLIIFKTIDESTFAFDKEQFDSFPDNVNVDGYRQTENILSILRIKFVRTSHLIQI